MRSMSFLVLMFTPGFIASDLKPDATGKCKLSRYTEPVPRPHNSYNKCEIAILVCVLAVYKTLLQDF